MEKKNLKLLLPILDFHKIGQELVKFGDWGGLGLGNGG